MAPASPSPSDASDAGKKNKSRASKGKKDDVEEVPDSEPEAGDDNEDEEEDEEEYEIEKIVGHEKGRLNRVRRSNTPSSLATLSCRAKWRCSSSGKDTRTAKTHGNQRETSRMSRSS